ncbi:MAG: hypothetical protein ABSG76_20220 [Xanthobacteraceae bacterium]
MDVPEDRLCSAGSRPMGGRTAAVNESAHGGARFVFALPVVVTAARALLGFSQREITSEPHASSQSGRPEQAISSCLTVTFIGH